VKAVADKGYDSQAVIEAVQGMGAEAVISTLSTRKERREIDKTLDKERNLAERLWREVKDFRRVATRDEKTDASHLAFVHVASLMALLR
jgi:transposase